jgi:hypothetical protein
MSSEQGELTRNFHSAFCARDLSIIAGRDFWCFDEDQRSGDFLQGSKSDEACSRWIDFVWWRRLQKCWGAWLPPTILPSLR